MSLPNYATNIAIIYEGVVENIIWGYVYQLDEFSVNGREAVEYGNRAVQIGDTYDGENFYHDGEPVRLLQEELDDLDAFIIDELYNEIIDF